MRAPTLQYHDWRDPEEMEKKVRLVEQMVQLYGPDSPLVKGAVKKLLNVVNTADSKPVREEEDINIYARREDLQALVDRGAPWLRATGTPGTIEPVKPPAEPEIDDEALAALRKAILAERCGL